jgi:hypothetical protein
MLSSSSLFTARADAAMRPISWSLFISFARELDVAADFFTVGVSTVGGPDIIKGTDDVLQLWDKYQYLDYSNRVMTMEWSQSMDPLYSVQSAIGDIVLNNYDNYLAGDNFALPYRPVRLGAGFGNTMTGDVEILPQFIGVTEKAPTIDESAKTASYHVIDFMSTIYNRPLNQAIILTNVTTDDALDALLQLVGLSPTQYDLDPGFNVIPFLYFPADTKFGDAAQQLMQAEMGRLYMSETGRITFKNRQNFSDTPVWYFDRHNVTAYQSRKQDDIINVVEITANVRTVQAKQKYWELTSATEIPAGGSIDIWANFSDPVTTVDTPVYFTSATTSLYTTNKLEDGTGSAVTSGVSVTTTQFATSYLMTFTNANAYSVFISTIQLFATPAIAVKTVYIREQDDDSVAQYDEHVLQINNDFFIDESTATSKAKIILTDNATYGQVQQVTVKGHPGLQINDAITLAVRKRTYIALQGDTLTSVAAAYGTTLLALEALNPSIDPVAGMSDGTKVKLGIIPETYVITGIASHLNTPSFTQDLTLKPLTRTKYFTVGISTVGGTDIIAP